MAGPSVADYPELPKINGEIILETFSHKSLAFPYNPDESFDNERLSELGATVLQLAITNYLYCKRPVISASDIPDQREAILIPQNFEKWVKHYNLRQRLRYNNSDTVDIMSPEETKTLFQAYVGAVHIQSGPNIAINWIIRLIDPEATVPSDPEETEDVQRSIKRPRVNPNPLPPDATPPPIPAGLPPVLTPVSTPASTSASSYGTAPVTASIGPQSMSPSITSSAAPKAPSFLPVFNQRCSQQHLQLEYTSENHGTPHAPVWVMKCLGEI
ncbi:hypothetical protein DFH11DRAFT_1721826 [Phellopilus nigrolimitatus]|nr:hypothetical protein DFH11DRAFT_1721826 [Phellopilus nigrolimitatus]